jgi:hypothetical protein
MRADEVIARARLLRAEARAVRATARATREHVAATVRSYRRAFLIARGANDDAVETRVLRCPHCQSERVRARGPVTAARGVVKTAHRCEACDKPFVFVRSTSVRRVDRHGPAQPPIEAHGSAAVPSPLCIVFLCPLCREHGDVTPLQAELEHDGELLVVAEVAGCAHADGFGDPERLTLAQEWRLITAALEETSRRHGGTAPRDATNAPPDA